MGLEHGLVDTQHLFDGFASNAVMSIIAVMIIGAGLDKTGLMSKVASYILKVGGSSEKSHHSNRLRHGRYHFFVYAKRRRRGFISAGREPDFCAFGPADVTPADADGFHRDSRWHRDHGGFITVDFAKRLDSDLERTALTRRSANADL